MPPRRNTEANVESGREERVPETETFLAALEEEFASREPSVLLDEESPPRLKSLALSPTTPRIAVIVIPLLTLFAHGLFIYGQTAPMWRLHLSQNVSVWANASDAASTTACATLGLPYENRIFLEQEDDVRVFNYNYVITELWRAKGMPGKFLPRLTALLLVFCSGIWPHLKLFLLNLTFLYPMQNLTRRKRFLHWLSTLGKWSLADVLTVCVMIAVLNIEWVIDPDAIKNKLIEKMPFVVSFVRAMYTPNSLCTKLLHYGCSHPSNLKHRIKCKTCKSFVYEAYHHPSWVKDSGDAIFSGMATSGGGLSKLSVLGMRGIYSFCFAVVLSILLSLIVDILDTRSRKAVTSTTTPRIRWTEVEQDGEVSDPLLEEQGRDTSGRPLVIYTSSRENRWDWRWWLHQLLPIVTGICVVLGLVLPTMGRRAYGAVPELLKEVMGVSWERFYSYISLMRITGEAGGWDILLMGTFNLSIVFGPVLRSALNLLALSSLTPNRYRPFLARAVDFIGAFCAWEVLLVAVVMESMLMPSITETIFMNHKCLDVSPDSCFKVNFDIFGSFSFLIVGLVLLISTSALSMSEARKFEVNELVDAAAENESDPEPYTVQNGGDNQYSLLNGAAECPEGETEDEDTLDEAETKGTTETEI